MKTNDVRVVARVTQKEKDKITPLRKQRQSSIRILERNIPTIQELLQTEREIELENNNLERKYTR